MKRIALCIVSVISLSMTLPARAFEEPQDKVSPPTLQLDGLKARIQENDPNVQTTFAELNAFFAAHPNDDGHARFLNIKSYFHILKQDYVSAYEALLEARKYATSVKNLLDIAESYRLEGLILDLSGEHASALEAMHRALDIYNEAGSDRVLLVYSAMGNVYMSLKDYELMLTFGHQYLSAAQRFNSKEGEGTAYFFQGYAQRALGKYQDAKVSLLLAESLLREADYPFIGIVHSAMAELHIAQGNLSEALKKLNQAAEADRQVGFRYNEGSHLLHLVDIYLQQGEVELAIAELEAGLKKDIIKNDKALVIDVLNKLIPLYEEKGDIAAALEYSKQYQQVFKQSFNEQQSRLMALHRVRLAISEKEETIKLLEKDNQLKEEQNLIQQKKNTQQLYFIGFVILSLGLVVGLLVRARQQRKTLDTLTQDLRKATKAKSDFLARMSHEIRTPLNAIIGLTKLSQRAAEDKEQQTNLIQIEGASQTLLSIINDILDFSKIEAGKLDIESTQFNLDALVNQTIRLHLARAQEKHIELIQHISRDVPLNLIGDPLRIQQVLNNLLSNALKFTEDGLISVSVRCKQVSEDIQLEFEVKDSGVGLSSAHQALLFQPFNQGDETISRRYGGTGLGLAICKQLTALMGGEIWVESQLGKGSIFHFTVKVQQDASQQIISPSTQLSALKVLIADDIEASRDAISEALSMANIQADIATGGKDAVVKMRSALATSTPYDVLILDWSMPDIDGLEVTAIMNQEFSIKQPKVIMLYAFESPRMREQANQLGIRNFIKKPFSTSELVDKLQELCLDVKTKALPKDKPTVPNLKGTRILFAEDNALNQKVTLGLLSDTHATIEVANNGLEAISILRKDSAFDVVLMDIQMPVMDGLTAAKHIREELKLTLPIIATTAHAMQQDIDKSLAAGMDGHINKPVDPNRFFDVLVEVLDKRQSSATTEVISETSVAPTSLTFIDKPTALKTLLGDETLYSDLLNDFVALEGELSALRQAIDNHNYPAIARIAHIFTTTLRYIGAFSLAELASSIELAIKRNEHEADEEFNDKLEILHNALVELSARVERMKG
ncbi:response regulator [Alteromonas mediterranea]|nr:response regulator [Alteromonas mediterranea]AFV86411.1 sensory box histidine kinase/response regulator [Alteromonas mediterranea DE1]AGP98423.1 sensory box histidine kinase/response regulator [Alteromonas mediterranea UM7]AGQ02677.1 sensory box histidine kinase/response regulator [Alteromonas mediterranea UM4b]HBL21416.1 hybrid sensor histidine kinase/response regulator [Alteromonas mediterranea]